MQLRSLGSQAKHLLQPTHFRHARSSVNWLLQAMTLGAVVSTGAPALAQTLPASQYYTAQVYGQRVGEFGGPFSSEGMGNTAQARAAGGTDWSGSASSDETLGGSVAAEASIMIPAGAEETYTSEVHAAATLHYLFYVEGPSTSALVPVLLLGSGSVSSHGYPGVASAGLDFFHDGITSNWTATLYANQSGGNGFEVNELFYLRVGQSYSLTTFAEASAIRSYIDSDDRAGSTTAGVDPTFTIQGDFVNSYHFVGLPESAVGGTAVAMVPEPETWALLSVGLGVMGWAKRRRRS